MLHSKLQVCCSVPGVLSLRSAVGYLVSKACSHAGNYARGTLWKVYCRCRN